MKQLLFEPKETERVFKDDYENLYNQITATGECKMKEVLDSLDWSSTGGEQKRNQISSIAKKELDATISRLK